VIELYRQRQRRAESACPGLIVVLDVPLLFEAGLEKAFDFIVVVSVDPQIQLQRLQERDRLSLHKARKRVESQMPLPEKAARADFVIENSGRIESTEAQVERLWHLLQKKA